MLQIGAQTKIYISTFAIDFRVGIDGLCAMIKSQLNLDPITGALFAFPNNRKSGIKFIIYDGQEYWFCYKRLSQGRIQWWPSGGDPVVPLDTRNLLLLIHNGYPLKVNFQKN